MSDKIEGVPEGWKAVRWDYVNEKQNYIDDDDVVMWLPSKPSRSKRLIVERDVKIIDMSQCLLDIEVKSATASDEDENWIVIGNNVSSEYLNSRRYCSRVRLNEVLFVDDDYSTKLPNGLTVEAIYSQDLDQTDNRKRVMFKNSKDIDWTEDTLIGVIVKGTAENYAYAHEFEGDR